MTYPGHCGYRSHKLASVGREEGVCFCIRSTLPPLISDTLVTGLALPNRGEHSFPITNKLYENQMWQISPIMVLIISFMEYHIELLWPGC